MARTQPTVMLAVTACERCDGLGGLSELLEDVTFDAVDTGTEGRLATASAGQLVGKGFGEI